MALAVGPVFVVSGGMVLAQPAATSSATPTATVAESARLVLFEDDFSTYSRRWLEQKTPKSEVAYRAGALVMRVVSPGVSVWSVPDFEMPAGAYTLRVTVALREGSADSQVGCLVAVTTGPTFLAFAVGRDGTWQFQRLVGEQWETITEGVVVRTNAGPTLNLRVDDGQQGYVLWVDEQIAARVRAEVPLAEGGFGLMTRAGHGWVEAAFTMVEVSPLVEEMDVTKDESDK